MPPVARGNDLRALGEVAVATLEDEAGEGILKRAVRMVEHRVDVAEAFGICDHGIPVPESEKCIVQLCEPGERQLRSADCDHRPTGGRSVKSASSPADATIATIETRK